MSSSSTEAPLSPDLEKNGASSTDVTKVGVAPAIAKPENAPSGAPVDPWDTDPENPRNWSSRKKWTMTAIVSAYNFVPPLASSMMAPALPQIAEHFNITSQTVVSLTLSIFLLSFAIGPLLFAPLSEVYGRTWVLHGGNLAFLAFSLGCAYSKNAGTLAAMRFMSGLAGSGPIACGGGSIGDLFAPRERAGAMAVFSLGPLVRPVVGPNAGGFIASTVGYKWIFITIAATCGVLAAAGLPLLRETYAPVIRVQRGDDGVKLPGLEGEGRGAVLRMIWLNTQRPIILLTRSFICFILSVYMSLIYGTYYLMFTTFPGLFLETYHFSVGVSGLAYLGLGIGFVLSTLIGAKAGNAIYQRLADRNGGVGKPEMRIPALIFGSFFIPVGLFWYGWSAEAKLHWIMPIIGTAIFAFGFMTAFLPIQLYLVDAFTYAASALAAASVLRSLFGFAFPLFGAQMFDALGTGGGNSLLGGLAIVLGIPFPIWIYFKGEDMRKGNPLNR
ncbi:multidrug resistance protein 4 [Auriscalpium vulgare]|uniref:Multidrug resistance protein 4 n=1 Tax=Auriscalpium vulgare TaxID=40419 RepID=A0ACB8SD32_9AGAM|nr:multidrug resistance protein 4 [Auriscalpium vulgare]